MLHGRTPRKSENTLKGLKAAILIGDRKVILSQFDNTKTKQLSNLIQHLPLVAEEKNSFKRIVIEAKKGKFLVFYHENWLLGILTDVEINFPLLKHLAEKTLTHLEYLEEKVEVDEIEKRVRNFL